MIWVEVLDRHGHVAQRVRCAALPATFGRAWTNDVVLDDRYVDPVHARLVRDEHGALALVDAGSLNGMTDAGGAQVTQVGVAGPTTVCLGQTTVRLVPTEAPVAPAVPLPSPTRGVRALVTTPRSAIAVAVLGLAVSVVALWARDPDADSPRTVVGGVLALASLVAAWAGVWALIGRSVIHQARFLSHFAAAWLALLVLEVVGTAAEWTGFMLNAGWLAGAVDAAAAIAGAVVLLAAHFAFATAMSVRRRAIVAAAIVLGITGAVVLLDETARGEMGAHDVPISASVRPAPAALVRADDFDGFLAGAAALRHEVDELAKAADR